MLRSPWSGAQRAGSGSPGRSASWTLAEDDLRGSGPPRGGEVGGQGEPVAAHDGPSPLDRATAQLADPVDGEGSGGLVEVQQAPLGRGRDDGPHVLSATGQPDVAAGVELGVERGLGEVGSEHRGGESGGEPDPVQRERLSVGEAQSLQVDQRRGLLDPQPGGDRPVGTGVEGANDAGLRLPGRLDRGEQAVEGALRRRDLGERRRGGPPAAGVQQTVLAQPPQRLAHGVAADAVVEDQCHLARELVGELPPTKPGGDVGAHLSPQRKGAVPVDAGGPGAADHGPGLLTVVG